MYVYRLHGYLVAHRGQKRTLNPLGMELQKVVSCQVGSRDRTSVLCENSMRSYQLGISHHSTLCENSMRSYQLDISHHSTF